MSRLYGEIQGDQNKIATKSAHRVIRAHLRNYTEGYELVLAVDDEGVMDVHLYETGGSKSPSYKKVLLVKQR